jgi:enamine deaminase RidA (YjgF/YER057c/UK114 family)
MPYAMTIERRNVPGLAPPPGYQHLAIVSESRLIFVAGQVSLDENGTLVGWDNPHEQARQCMRNLLTCLAAAGARPEDVVRTTVYVVPSAHATLGQVWHELLNSELGVALGTPATLLGVQSLGYEGQLVEIECTAAIGQ